MKIRFCSKKLNHISNPLKASVCSGFIPPTTYMYIKATARATYWILPCGTADYYWYLAQWSDSDTTLGSTTTTRALSSTKPLVHCMALAKCFNGCMQKRR